MRVSGARFNLTRQKGNALVQPDHDSIAHAATALGRQAADAAAGAVARHEDENRTTGYLIRRVVLFGWLGLTGVVWALFVPRALAVGSFWVFALTGPVLAVVLLMLWSS